MGKSEAPLEDRVFNRYSQHSRNIASGMHRGAHHRHRSSNRKDFDDEMDYNPFYRKNKKDSWCSFPSEPRVLPRLTHELIDR
jgi:hypothetical protein